VNLLYIWSEGWKSMTAEFCHSGNMCFADGQGNTPDSATGSMEI